ncbi:MAG: hypothetical protein ACK4OK_10015 [Thermoflexus sp.]
MGRRVGDWGPWIIALAGIVVGVGLGVRALSELGGAPGAWLEAVARSKPALWGDPTWYGGLFLLYVLLLALSINSLGRG